MQEVSFGVPAGNPGEANMEVARRMQQMIWHMKEVPELPSEKPKDVMNLEKSILPEGGGILTYLRGCEYPYRGFPYTEFVEKIDFIKKVGRGVLSGLFHELKSRNKFLLLTILPVLWLLKSAVYAAIYSVHRLVSRSLIKPQMYSQAIAELHRAFSVDTFTEDGKTRMLRTSLRDIVCMILEFDNAYRFRFQDVIVELNKENLKKNPTEELCRILTVMQSREFGQDVKDTWYLLKLLCRTFLRVDKRLRTILTDVLSRLDLEKVALTPEDKFFLPKRKDFQAGFLKGLRDTDWQFLTDERKKDRLIIEKAFLSWDISEERTRIIDAYNTEAAKDNEEYEAEKNKIEGELSAMRDGLKKLEDSLNEEATKQKLQIDGLCERVPETKDALQKTLQEDIAKLQERYNAEAQKVTPQIQERINALVEMQAQHVREQERIQKEYDAKFEENQNSYSKKVEELKKLCQPQASS